MITIVDYGVGNTGSLLNMYDYLGFEARVSGDVKEIANAQCLVLPGVGAFDKAMVMLRERQLIEPLNKAVLERRVPVLGICLGMQLLARGSEEGIEVGLGWIPADVQRITVPLGSMLKVPHINWADICLVRSGNLFDLTSPRERFYFNHSYHMVCDDYTHITATVDYGRSLTCAIKHDNIYGVQFHPEKSHRFGMRLLKAFGTIAAKGAF